MIYGLKSTERYRRRIYRILNISLKVLLAVATNNARLYGNVSYMLVTTEANNGKREPKREQ